MHDSYLLDIDFCFSALTLVTYFILISGYPFFFSVSLTISTFFYIAFLKLEPIDIVFSLSFQFFPFPLFFLFFLFLLILSGEVRWARLGKIGRIGCRSVLGLPHSAQYIAVDDLTSYYIFIDLFNFVVENIRSKWYKVG